MLERTGSSRTASPTPRIAAVRKTTKAAPSTIAWPVPRKATAPAIASTAARANHGNARVRQIVATVWPGARSAGCSTSAPVGMSQ